jgi:C4-dicarboxylate-specific signal transduction histidine kinase
LLIKTEYDEGDRVRLSVKDAGVGFPPQAADKLFDAFFTTKSDGMGIGLSTAAPLLRLIADVYGRPRTMAQEPRLHSPFLAGARGWPTPNPASTGQIR